MFEFELLDRTEAAKFLGVRPQTLAAWACHGVGPAVSKIGRRAMYRKDILAGYVEQQTVPRKKSSKEARHV